MVTTLLNYNCCDLEAICDLLVEQQVAVWQIQLATAMGNMAGSVDLRLDPLKFRTSPDSFATSGIERGSRFTRETTSDTSTKTRCI